MTGEKAGLEVWEQAERGLFFEEWVRHFFFFAVLVGTQHDFSSSLCQQDAVPGVGARLEVFGADLLAVDKSEGESVGGKQGIQEGQQGIDAVTGRASGAEPEGEFPKLGGAGAGGTGLGATNSAVAARIYFASGF